MDIPVLCDLFEIIDDQGFDNEFLFEKRIVWDSFDQSPMWPSILVEPFELIETHGAEQPAGSDMHELLFLPLGELHWPFAQFLHTDQEQHDLDIRLIHVKLLGGIVQQFVPPFIYLRCVHWANLAKKRA